MLTLMGSTQSFYFSTLEEYYTGGLYLGIGNGVTDGSAPIIALFIYCGFYGNDFFKKEVSLGSNFQVKISQIMAFILISTQLIAVLMK